MFRLKIFFSAVPSARFCAKIYFNGILYIYKKRPAKMQTIDEALEKLGKSKFRSGFRLNEKDREYVRQKGMDTVRSHAADFVRRRLAPGYIPNDGRQTPMRGHPVFKAQHACACCCRGCLNKWYRVPEGVELSETQQQKIVNLLMAWIERQMG